MNGFKNPGASDQTVQHGTVSNDLEMSLIVRLSEAVIHHSEQESADDDVGICLYFLAYEDFNRLKSCSMVVSSCARLLV